MTVAHFAFSISHAATHNYKYPRDTQTELALETDPYILRCQLHFITRNKILRELWAEQQHSREIC